MLRPWHNRYDIAKYTRLWQNVLLQLLQDLLSKNISPDAELHRYEARQILDIRNLDFRILCENASFEPIHVHEAIQRTLAAGDVTAFDLRMPARVRISTCKDLF